jgi:dolichyl-phosphate beta-glucosyltransferase
MAVKQISLIVPVYNESLRLSSLFKEIDNFSKKWKGAYEVIFVNDGSSDSSLFKIKDFVKDRKHKSFKIVSYKKNQGKGHALKKGIAKAKYLWILTFDADVSVKILCFLKYKKYYTFNKKFCYFGSRTHYLSRTDTIFIRRFIGKILGFIIYMILRKKTHEFQCGYKIYHISYIKKIFKKVTCKGFAHDFELLLLLKKNSIEVKNCPVIWHHRPGSKLNIFTDSFMYFFWLFKISRKFNFKY